MEYLAKLHSMEDEVHSHTQNKVLVDVIRWENDGNIIVKKQDGTICSAVFNPFCATLFVDDIYGIINFVGDIYGIIKEKK